MIDRTMQGTRFAVGRAVVALAAAALLAGPLRAQGQDSSRERFRVIQERASERAAEETALRLPDPGERELEIAGWSSTTFLNIQDDDRNRRALDSTHGLLIQDYRVFMAAEASDELKAYIRLRHLRVNFYTQPGATETDTRSQEGLELDLAYLDYSPDEHLRVRGGRQFVTVGRGLTLALDLDGADVLHTLPDWTYRLFAGRTLRRDFNIDDSILGFEMRTQRRWFYLAEVEHRLEDDTRYTAYFVVQQDRSRSRSAFQAARAFRYNSHYLGLSTEGQFHPMLTYYLEAVHQGGSSMVDVLGDPRVDIDAWGVLAGLLHYPRHRWRPQATLEYAFGSGDSTRSSVTNTFQGKRRPNLDRNFLYFGAYDGGLDLSPRLSNLHVLRAGYQVKPLPEAEDELPELLIGGTITRYFKDLARGSISDTLPLPTSSDIGYGYDLFVAARPLSDTSVLAQYGLFDPGRAYPPQARDTGRRFLITTTLSF